MNWFIREMRLMCRQGLTGVIACGIICTLILNIPMIVGQVFFGWHYYKFFP